MKPCKPRKPAPARRQEAPQAPARAARSAERARLAQERAAKAAARVAKAAAIDKMRGQLAGDCRAMSGKVPASIGDWGTTRTQAWVTVAGHMTRLLRQAKPPLVKMSAAVAVMRKLPTMSVVDCAKIDEVLHEAELHAMQRVDAAVNQAGQA